MLKWLITVVIALVLLSAATPWLARLGFGRLPGDLHFRRKGRDYSIPVASTILLSAALSLIVWVLH